MGTPCLTQTIQKHRRPKHDNSLDSKAVWPLSADLATAVSLVGSVVIVYLYSSKIFDASIQMLRGQLGRTHLTLDSVGSEISGNSAQLFRLVGECTVAVLAFVLAAWAIQTGLIFSLNRIVPDPSRMNPVNGLQRIFSVSNLLQAFLTLLKISIVSVASIVFFRANAESIAGVGLKHASLLASESGLILYHLVLTCTGTLILFGIVDYVAKRNQFEASLRSMDEEPRTAIRSVTNNPSAAAKNRYRPQRPQESTSEVK